MSTDIVNFRPPRIAISLLAMATVVHALTPLSAIRAPSSAWLGVLVGLAGFVTMMVAWWQFHTTRVPICPTEPTPSLITDGVYRYTRNPMYLGIVMMLAGIAASIGTVPFFAATLAFIVVINQVFCPYEEAKLRLAFGNNYTNYAARVRRWI